MLQNKLRFLFKIDSSIIIFMACFFILYAFGVPVEEYDGYNRRLVADSLWYHGSLRKTWFDLGSILSLYCFYFPAHFLIKYGVSFKLSELSILLHSTFFVAAISALMAHIWLSSLDKRKQGFLRVRFVVCLASFFLNPLLFTFQRYLIETPLAFWLMLCTWIWYKSIYEKKYVIKFIYIIFLFNDGCFY